MPDPIIPSSRVQLVDVRSGIITREWFRFLEALLNMALNSDFYVNVARGVVSGMSSVNVWGRAPDGLQTTATDIWDRADSTPTQQIWLAPTAARVHAIVSTSANDDGNPVGTGARTVTVYGLKTWTSAESSEVVTLNGVGAVNTANSYVIIHKMVVTTFGSAGPNVGTITATAATDATVTAAIRPGLGTTQMAILGVPSGQSAFINRVKASVITDSSLSANFTLVAATDPANFPARFTTVRTFGDVNSGSSNHEEVFQNPLVVAGPCILKLQGIASPADTDASGGLDLLVVSN